MEEIKQTIERAIGELGLPEVEFVVEHPADEKFGDYSTNIAMQLFAKLKAGKSSELLKSSELMGAKSPRELAEKIVEKMHNDTLVNRLIDMDRTSVAGPGFINFWLKDEYLAGEVDKALGEGYGENESAKGKKAIVEYSSPNIAKPFTVGHLRSTVIGDSIANILDANGWEVLRDNHLGDWGTQFGKQIAAIKHWGEEGKEVYTVKELVELYVKFHKEAEKNPELDDEARAWFKKLEDGDEEARAIWKMCVESSWIEFHRIYETLGVKHSEEFEGGRGLGESFFENKMDTILDILRKNKLLQEGKEGAQLVFFPDDKFPPAMILKKDGTTLYHTRDLATDYYRKQEYNPDLIINEVGAEQELYFRQLFEMEYMLGWYKEGQRVHVKHGMYRFSEGKMSTRKGNVIWLDEVLEQARRRAYALATREQFDEGKRPERDEDGGLKGWDTRMDKMSREVGIGALKWNDLKGEAKRDIVFDWDNILSMQGDSGPYVQYTYARASSILRKADTRTSKHAYTQTEELSLVRWVARYPEVVLEAGEKFAPNVIASYIYELATRFNSFYNGNKIVGNESRVVLTRAVANVLKSGLNLLGIAAPESM